MGGMKIMENHSILSSYRWDNVSEFATKVSVAVGRGRDSPLGIARVRAESSETHN